MEKDDIIKKITEIQISVGLDAQNIPQKMEWQARDNPKNEAPRDSKGLLLSLFDSDTRDTYKIDLWTTDMQVIEMDRFIYQTLRGIADTYFKATQNKELANEMQRFVQYFGEKTEVLPK